MVLPIPPIPSSASTRHCLASTRPPRSASSWSRPTKPTVSGASPQSWTRETRTLGGRGAWVTAFTADTTARTGGRSATAKQVGEPGIVKRKSQTWRLMQRRIPQRSSFVCLAAGAEPAHFQVAGDERLKAFGVWIADARLPTLDGTRVRSAASQVVAGSIVSARGRKRRV